MNVRYGRTLDPEMAAAMARMREIAAGLPDRYSLPFDEARAQLAMERRWWCEEAPRMAAVTDAAIDVTGRAVGLRRYRPGGSAIGPVIIYLHGGGWCVGDNDTHDGIQRHLAAASGVDVVGVAYSLAPEHPFPAAVEDVAAAVSHLTTRGEPFVLAGDSAGANLALVEAIRRRDARLRAPAGLALFYGAFGPLRLDGSGAAYGSGEFGLSIAAQRRYLDAYLGSRPTDDVRAYPMHDTLDGLPPALLVAAQLDPLLDDSLEMATRLGAAGNAMRLEVYDGVVHGFLSCTRMVSRARDALLSAGTFAVRCLR
jgi:acetyl esterase